jgi:hypothetical protein
MARPMRSRAMRSRAWESVRFSDSGALLALGACIGVLIARKRGLGEPGAGNNKGETPPGAPTPAVSIARPSSTR